MIPYQDISLTEIPGEISLVIYNPSCNMRCPHCFNSELLDKKPLSYKQMKDMVKEHKDFVGGVVFSGGEPLGNPFLRKILSYCSDCGLKTKLNTNGLVPDTVRKNCYTPYVDYANISIKGLPQNYHMAIPSHWEWLIHCDVLEYSFVYCPVLWNNKTITEFRDFVANKISHDWRVAWTKKWSRPDIFTVTQMQTGHCLNSQYNSYYEPTREQCIEIAKLFKDIPRKKLMIETKEFGKEKVLG